MPELAYVNGTFLPIEKAMVPVEDRGYQFGDAVYEYIASYNGRLFFQEAHLDRLDRSLNALSFPAISKENIREAVNELFHKAALARAGVYIQISRGVAPRNHAFPDAPQAQVVMTVRKVHETDPKLRQAGAVAITVKDFRWGRCDIKTVQILANVLAKQKAVDSGAYDAIFVAENGVVREATSSNVFIVVQGTLVTHPLTENILPGITRAVVLNCAKEMQLETAERFYGIEELYGAEEVFLTGTTTEVLPIVTIDGKTIADGQVGPFSRRLGDALRKKCIESE
ncbi:MAG: D-amino acid aminotransferase [Desulfobacterales bacterium]|nr:D-amino acid aminotransferase [Desulfobacterales bacterium]